MIMNRYLAALSFIALFSLSNVCAQNLAHMVERPNSELLTTNLYRKIEPNTKLTPAKIDVVGLQRHFFISLPPLINCMINCMVGRLSKITNEGYFQFPRFKEK